MTSGTLQETEHTRTVAAPASVLYDLIADVTRWPAIFGPSLHVEHIERDEREERFRLWALVNGAVADWTSKRSLEPESLLVRFGQERSHPPVASMGGEWEFREKSAGLTEVVLRHHFSLLDDKPATARSLRNAVDRNSTEELEALARIAECGHPVDEVLFSFTDTVDLPCGSDTAYDFINEADLWPQRLPHVRRVRLDEDTPGVQQLEMETLTADGSTHTTRSIRICQDNAWIAYKQLKPPHLLLGHSGLWTFHDGKEGSRATARHTVVIDPVAAAEMFGKDRALADAREYLRYALGRNSRTTMLHAARTDLKVK
ncbi:aromatase/cyclase [Amycolatopsis sp. TRM77291]